MDYIAVFMLGAMFGIVCMMVPKCFNTPAESKSKADETPHKPDKQQAKMQEQWDNFLNYTGNEQNGGVSDE